MLLRFKCCCHRTTCNKMSFLDMIKEWRFWLRLLILTFYFLIIVVLLPFLVLQAIKDGFKKKDYFIPVIGGVFVIMTLPMSLWLIINHMIYYSKPRLQKHIIRILWMVPIYSLNAWFSLLDPDNVIYLNGFRECYEAYVIYSFMMFLFNYLHEKCDDLATTLERKPQTTHIFPLCFLDNWKMGRDLIHKCKHGILQYTVVRPLTTILGIVCYINDQNGVQCKVIYFITMAVNNLSQFAAMYCLVLFYRATKEELAPMRPVGKFLCIKAVIFFSFFQGVIITVLVETGMLNPVLNMTISFQQHVDIASYIQNFFICFEMFLAAIGHHYSFTVDSYAESICSHKSWREALYALWDFSDVGADIKEHLGVVGNSLTRHIRPRSGPVSVNTDNIKDVNETSPLLVETQDEVVHRSAVRRDVTYDFASSSSINATNIC